MSYFCFGWTSSFQLSWDFSSDTEFDVYCGLSSREIKDPSAHTTTEISQGGEPQKLDSNLQLLFENRKLLSVLSEEKTLDFLLLDLELKFENSTSGNDRNYMRAHLARCANMLEDINCKTW